MQHSRHGSREETHATVFYCYTSPMTDEGSVPPNPTPSAEMPLVQISEQAPIADLATSVKPVLVPTSESMISTEAVQEISASITEAVKEVIMQEVPSAEAVPAPTPTAPTAPTAVSAPSAPVAVSKVSSKNHMLEVVRARKAERLEKIIEMTRLKKDITNDDVEKLLKVSNATATRYLNDLVKAGRLKRFGARKHEKYEVI